MDDNKYKDFDLMMRSVLENAEEEVPAGIWDSVAEGLDKAARKMTVVLMWRRAAVGFGVAAALAVGLVLNHEESVDMVSPASSDEGMIAVVEKPVSAVQEDEFGEDVMLAYTEEATSVPENVVKTPFETIMVQEESVDTQSNDAHVSQQAEMIPDDAPEEHSPSQNNLTYQPV